MALPVGKSLEGDDLTPFYLFRVRKAGECRSAVEENRAATTDALRCATVLGGSDAALGTK